MDRFQKVILLTCGFLTLARASACFFPGQRLWGVNLLSYMPPAWRWILPICALLILIPSISKACGSLFTALSRTIPPGLKRAGRYYRYALFSIMAGVLFWLLRVKTYLLGDSLLRAREIDMGAGFSFTAPLDFLLHVQVAGFLNWEAFQTYALLSILSGMGFVFLLLLLADLMGRDGKERLLVFSVFISMGAIQLFFGYVESYSVVSAAILLYIFFSFGYLRNKHGLIPPVLAFLLAFSLHLFAVTLLPSLLYLILSRRAGKKEKKQGNFAGLSLSTGIVLLVVVALSLVQRYNPDRISWI